jgi:hypothetical protein
VGRQAGRLRFAVEDGLAVLCTSRSPSTATRAGSSSWSTVEPLGLGALSSRRQLKRRLDAEDCSRPTQAAAAGPAGGSAS